ncbi:MAG: nucleotidyltransferase domain-containing protein [Candidatus Levyibacteriota bacterium]
MAEATVGLKLEQKRFVVNPESLGGMEKIKSTFNELKEEFPWLSGLGFFGSRTKGMESEGSDYDICVFYNMNRMPEEKQVLLGGTEDWDRIRERIEKGLGVKLDSRFSRLAGGLHINISKGATNNRVENFIKAAEPFVNRKVDKTELMHAIGIPSTQDLYSQFFLAVGDEVYESRKYILDQLRDHENGEEYFKMLMDALGWFERGLDQPSKPHIPYRRYPQTIEQAEKYFLTK